MVANSLHPTIAGSRLAALFMIMLTVQALLVASAQQNCNIEFFDDEVASSSDERVRLSLLRVIDRSNYEQSKRKASASALTVIGGVPLSATADYEDFNEKRSREFQKFGFNYEKDVARSYVSSRLSDNGLAAYSQCLQNQVGLNVWTGNVNEDIVDVYISWKPPPGAIKNAKIELFWTNALGSPPEKITLEPSDTLGIPVKRVEGEQLRLLINGNGYTSSATVAPPPVIIPVPTVTISLGSCRGHGGVEGVEFWGPPGEPCVGIGGGWGVYGSAIPAQTTERICGCKGHGGVEGVTLWGPEGFPCGGIPVWGNYSFPCTEPPKVTICSCKGRGNVIGDFTLWGPQGFPCSGFDGWGRHEDTCVEGSS